MPDYGKRYALIKKRPLTLIGKDSCPSQSDTAPPVGAASGAACSNERRHKIAIGI
jgi:hypothetical protein